jgi:hypothetical protein
VQTGCPEKNGINEHWADDFGYFYEHETGSYWESN